jgi:hypothetical protein
MQLVNVVKWKKNLTMDQAKCIPPESGLDTIMNHFIPADIN